MKNSSRFLKVFLLLLVAGCAHQKISVGQPGPSDKPLAFPGAEGFGKYTIGGRGGKIMIVSNLNDDGEGSFRKAVTAKDPRIVLFSVSGTIHLNSPVSIKGDLTIAGQSAPGDGICLADYPIQIGGNNIIVRYLRFRMGDKNQNKGMVDGAGGDDAFGGTHRNNIVIDHCSMSWSTDEVFSVYAGDSTSLQWNLIAEPLNYSYHFEEGDKDFEHHGYGAIWGGKHLSAHHNLFAHCNNRNPRFDGIRNSPIENVDYRNNVIYDWGSNSIYAGEGGNYNIVNNYFKYGPSTSSTVKKRICNPGKRDTGGFPIPFGKWFVSGNYVDEFPEVTADNKKGVDMMNGGTAEDKTNTLIDKAIESVELPVQSATDAYEQVMKWVGASYKRDTMDQRLINDVKNRTGRFIDVQGGYSHGTPYEQSKNAWPILNSLSAPADADHDGMPDAWEKKNGLNTSDPTDATQFKLQKNYTNIEVYLNSLLK